MNDNYLSYYIWTKHALRQAQRRGISFQYVQSTLLWGTLYWAGRGAVAYYLDQCAMKLAMKSGVILDSHRSIAVIVEQSSIVTVMHAPKPPSFWRRS